MVGVTLNLTPAKGLGEHGMNACVYGTVQAVYVYVCVWSETSLIRTQLGMQ